MSFDELLQCINGMWSPTIGDPTMMGWVTVGAYLGATVLCSVLVFKSFGRQRLFWGGLAVILSLLAINKQLDMQTALTAAGRCLAQAQGWYDQRQTVQLVFIGLVATSCFALAWFSVLFWRHEIRQIWLALLGFAFLLAFVAIRAAGFHHIDRFIGAALGSVRINWVLELGGIAAIAGNAAAQWRSWRNQHR